MRSDTLPWSVLAALCLAGILPAPARAAELGGNPGGGQPFVGETAFAHAVHVDLRTLPRARQWQPGDPVWEVPEAYLRAHQEPVALTVLRPHGPFADPVVQSDFGFPSTPTELSNPLVNIPGLIGGARPPDINGDVGPGHYIQMINSSIFAVYRKDGVEIVGPTLLESLWTAGGACSNGLGDPVVIYDDLADRWLMTEFATTGNHLCIYVSQTPDPVGGGWFLYDFTVPSFPDYPRYGMWPDAYYVTSFEGGSLGVFALDRERMLAGNPATFVRFTIPSLNPVGGMNVRETRILPADLDGAPPPPGSPNYFFRSVEALQDAANQVDRLEIFEFHVDWTTPANSTFTLVDTLAPANFALVPCSPGIRDCIPQPGTGVRLDALSNRPMRRLQYRNFGSHESLVVNQTVDAGGRAGIRWYELRKSGGDWSIHQQGTYAPDASSRFMGSMAMNGDGAIAVGYSVSDGAGVFPSIRYAARLPGDAPGTLPRGERTLARGGAVQSNSQRWGDYSALSIDPSDDATFWYTQQYVPTVNNQWQTRIGAFNFAPLYEDGFETGDTSRWTLQEPP